MKILFHGIVIFCASLTIQSCCTKTIRIPPRVDGDSITLESAREGYIKLIVQMEACELCDENRDIAEEITENAEDIFELRSDDLLTNDEYNAHIESIQVKLLEVRRVCNSLAIADKNAHYPGNEDKYKMSEKAADLTAGLIAARDHSAKALADARAYTKNK
ncbi:MAG: hypothetical protein NXI24_13685 [bacterium]|nr:hypothetical protein [bacterium]